MARYKALSAANALASNPLVKLWKHFGCGMDSKTFDSIYESTAWRFCVWRAERRLRKNLSPRLLKRYDSIR
jgi:hypothetical protein